MSARALSTTSSVITAAFAPALTALPGLARRGGSTRPPRICSRAQAEAELKAARATGVEFFALGEPEYPTRLQMIDDPPPVIAVRGKHDSAGAATGRYRRLAQRFSGRREICRTHRARSWRGRFCHCVRPRTRHRRRSPPRQRSTPAQSPCSPAATTGSIRPNTSIWSNRLVAEGAAHFGNAVHLGAARARLSTPQSADLGPLAWRGGGGGSAAFRLADHCAACRRTRAAKCSQCRALRSIRAAEGTNGLLKQGATLVTEAADVIAVIEPILGRGFDVPSAQEPSQEPLGRPMPNLTATNASASSHCSGQRPSRSTIWCGCRVRPPAIVRSVLLELEIAGRLERHGGGWYRCCNVRYEIYPHGLVLHG